MTPSDEKEFCNDIRQLLDFYRKASDKRKSGVHKLLSEVLAYAHPTISIDCSVLMNKNDKNSKSYPGYFISESVAEANKKNGIPKSINGVVQITDEHIIPKKVVIKYLSDLYKNKPKSVTDEMILYMTKLLSYSCLVTKEENIRLQKAKLTTKMPEGWKFPDHIDFTQAPNLKKLNFFARYEKAGIKWVKNEGVDENKERIGKYTGFYKPKASKEI